MVEEGGQHLFASCDRFDGKRLNKETMARVELLTDNAQECKSIPRVLRSDFPRHGDHDGYLHHYLARSLLI